MRINSIEFHDNARNWRLEKTTFDDFTLLVGASGVGKTQILDAIKTVKKIALGEKHLHCSWNIECSTLKHGDYRWEGKIEDDFVYEEVWKIDNKTSYVIAERDGEKGIFNNVPISVKISKEISLLEFMRAEDAIRLLRQEFYFIHDTFISSLYGSPIRYLEFLPEKEIDTMFSDVTLEADLIEKYTTGLHGYDFVGKIITTLKRFPDIAQKIISGFINIFPQVESVALDRRVNTIRDQTIKLYATANIIQSLERPALTLVMKEKGINEPIPLEYWSSGMQRVFFDLCEIFLSPSGTVLVIDEFENSLGVNCIGSLTEEILNSERNLQFIITSHHPYIINNVDTQYWKIVTRNGGVVRTHTAEELKLGKSKHQAFTELINRVEFRTGQEEELV
jgi:AAA15 family ATPase/GTPase